MVGLYPILKKVGNAYKIELLDTIKVHSIFSLNRLQKAANDPLPRQKNDPLLLIQVDSNDKWEVEEILASKIDRKTLKYRVHWKGYDPDLAWYPA